MSITRWLDWTGAWLGLCFAFRVCTRRTGEGERRERGEREGASMGRERSTTPNPSHHPILAAVTSPDRRSSSEPPPSLHAPDPRRHLSRSSSPYPILAVSCSTNSFVSHFPPCVCFSNDFPPSPTESCSRVMKLGAWIRMWISSLEAQLT